MHTCIHDRRLSGTRCFRTIAIAIAGAVTVLMVPALLAAQGFARGMSVQPYVGVWLGTTGLERLSGENRLGGTGGVEVARRVAPRLRLGATASYVRVNSASRVQGNDGAFVYDGQTVIVSLGGDYLLAGSAATRATLGAGLGAAWVRYSEAARIGTPRPGLGRPTGWDSPGFGIELRTGLERDFTPRAAIVAGLRGYFSVMALRVSPALTLGVRLR